MDEKCPRCGFRLNPEGRKWCIKCLAPLYSPQAPGRGAKFLRILSNSAKGMITVAYLLYLFVSPEGREPFARTGRLITCTPPHCFVCGRTATVSAPYVGVGATVTRWFCQKHPPPKTIGSVTGSAVTIALFRLLGYLCSIAAIGLPWSGLGLELVRKHIPQGQPFFGMRIHPHSVGETILELAADCLALAFVVGLYQVFGGYPGIL